MSTQKNQTWKPTHILAALALAAAPVLAAATSPESHAPVAEQPTKVAEGASKPTGGKRVTANDVARFKAFTAEHQGRAAYVQNYKRAIAIIVDELRSRKDNKYWVENTAAYLASIDPYSRVAIVTSITKEKEYEKVRSLAPLLGYAFASNATLRKSYENFKVSGMELIARDIMRTLGNEITKEQALGIQHLYSIFTDYGLSRVLPSLTPEGRLLLEELLAADIKDAHPRAKELAQKVHNYRKAKGCKVYGVKIPGSACDGLGL